MILKLHLAQKIKVGGFSSTFFFNFLFIYFSPPFEMFQQCLHFRPREMSLGWQYKFISAFSDNSQNKHVMRMKTQGWGGEGAKR